jgi:hypothetical protein
LLEALTTRPTPVPATRTAAATRIVARRTGSGRRWETGSDTAGPSHLRRGPADRIAVPVAGCTPDGVHRLHTFPGIGRSAKLHSDLRERSHTHQRQGGLSVNEARITEMPACTHRARFQHPTAAIGRSTRYGGFVHIGRTAPHVTRASYVAGVAGEVRANRLLACGSSDNLRLWKPR